MRLSLRQLPAVDSDDRANAHERCTVRGGAIVDAAPSMSSHTLLRRVNK